MVTDELPPAAPLPMATQPWRSFRKLTQASPTPFQKDPTSVHLRPLSVVWRRNTGRNSSAPESYTLTKKSAGLRNAAPVSPLANAKPARRSMGGETLRQLAPPSVVMSSRAELSSLAHPTRGVRKYTLSTSCGCRVFVAVVVCFPVELAGGEEDGVDDGATLGLAATISVMGTVATAPSLHTIGIIAPPVSSAVSRTTPPGDFAGRLCTRTLSSL